MRRTLCPDASGTIWVLAGRYGARCPCQKRRSLFSTVARAFGPPAVLAMIAERTGTPELAPGAAAPNDTIRSRFPRWAAVEIVARSRESTVPAASGRRADGATTILELCSI